MKTEFDFFSLFDNFITESRRGKRLKKDGTLIRKGTIKQYEIVRNEVLRFSLLDGYPMRLKNVRRFSARQLKSEKIYWKRFYRHYTDYLYAKGCYDNYVGAHVKTLRTFFNYLNLEKGIFTGDFHKRFYARNENIPIVVLTPDQLRFLIYDDAFEQSLSGHLVKTKDVFVFGCTVGLRVSDLMNLTKRNVERVGEAYYLRVRSIKTSTDTRIKLPDYAVTIIDKYKSSKTLLPALSCGRLNYNLKELCEKAGWTWEVHKSRERRGVTKKITLEGKPYRFCDLITTHTMRRTAITTLLSLGMPETMVRKISGHSSHSKEFFRYVNYAQQFIDLAIDQVYSNFKALEKVTEMS